LRRDCSRIFLESVHHARGIDKRRSDIDRGRNTQRLGNLVLACALFDRCLGMDDNAAVAAQRYSHRERDQFAGLGAEQILFWPAELSSI
jgi:hypothetical protein